MTKALTIQERASRQKIMMGLRRWMDMEGIPRSQVARDLGITVGHLSTLINANRTATEAQCQKSMILMDAKFAVSKHDPLYKELGVKPIQKRKEMRPEPRVTRKAKKKVKANKLRPLTRVETAFIAEVAKVWVKSNKGASKDDYIKIVNALSIGIRT